MAHTEPSESALILEQAKKALQASDFDLFCLSIARLATIEPARWIDLLFVKGIIPDPNPYNDKFDAQLQIIIKSLNKAYQENSIDSEYLFHLLLPLLSMRVKFISIKKELEELSLWKEPAVYTVIKTAVFVEDQSIF